MAGRAGAVVGARRRARSRARHAGRGYDRDREPGITMEGLMENLRCGNHGFVACNFGESLLHCFNGP